MFGAGQVRVAAACRGPKAERARRRVAKVAPCSNNRIVERSNYPTLRPTRCRALSGGRTPLGKLVAFRGRGVAAVFIRLLSLPNVNATPLPGEGGWENHPPSIPTPVSSTQRKYHFAFTSGNGVLNSAVTSETKRKSPEVNASFVAVGSVWHVGDHCGDCRIAA